MKLFLIRHGETNYTESGRLCGAIDAPLSRKGVAQARKLARQLKRHNRMVIYSSPLSRTMQTARIIAGQKARIIRCPELKETNLGRWEGLTFEEIRSRFPGAMQRWVKNPLTFGAPGGEKLRQLQKRVLKFLKRLERADHNGCAVTVVSHSGPIRIILGEISGKGLNGFWKTEPKTGCLIKLNGLSRLNILK
ncbi:MAG: histidine phosphatase family protein [Candidatus Brocadiia bacterium]